MLMLHKARRKCVYTRMLEARVIAYIIVPKVQRMRGRLDFVLRERMLYP